MFLIGDGENILDKRLSVQYNAYLYFASCR
jgi:hypothetical protein